MSKYCVIGSLNIDLVAKVNSFPTPGETVYGQSFQTYNGGKGANQAIALARLGANVTMIGKLGNDVYGAQYIEHLKNSGVQSGLVDSDPTTSSGIALIEVDRAGENHIIIVPGANGLVTPEYLETHLAEISGNDFILLQLEIPLDSVEYILQQKFQHRPCFILDPAPAASIPKHMFPVIDILTPNENELEHITGMEVRNTQDIFTAAKILLHKGVHTVIVKAGAEGAFLVTENTQKHIPGFKVNSIDTTGAGDAFNAGLAYALSKSNDMDSAVRYANAVGAISTQKEGAQSSMPTANEVNQFLGLN